MASPSRQQEHLERLLVESRSAMPKEYAGAEYRGVLAREGMPQSMSRAENCYENGGGTPACAGDRG